jgi:hypothetical protein
LNYHVLEKARGARAKSPGGSGGAQAARNTGPVIRIAIEKRREKLFMAEAFSGWRGRNKARISRCEAGSGAYIVKLKR